MFSFFFWKPAAAKTKHLFIFGMCKERSGIFAVLAGPGKVVSKIGKRCGFVLDSRSLHWLYIQTVKSLFFPEKRGVGTYTLIKAGLKIESISVKWLFSKQRIKLKSVWRTLCRLTCRQRERLHRQRFFQFSSCRERRTKNNSESLTSLELNMRKVDQFLMNSLDFL